MTRKTAITKFPVCRHYFRSEPCYYFDNLATLSDRKRRFSSHALILQNFHNTLSPVRVYIEQFGMNWHVSNGKSSITGKPRISHHGLRRGKARDLPLHPEEKIFQNHSHSNIQSLKRLKTHGGIILNLPRCVFPEIRFHKISSWEATDIDTKRTLDSSKSKSAELILKRMNACKSVALRPGKNRSSASNKRLFPNDSNVYRSTQNISRSNCKKLNWPTSCREQCINTLQQSISKQIQTDCSQEHEGTF